MNASDLASKRKQVQKTCKQCGRPFVGLKVALYHNESCRQKAKYLRNKVLKNTEQPLSTRLKLDRPYDWSNKNINKHVFMLRVLSDVHLPDIARCVDFFGKKAMQSQLPNISDPLTKKIAERKLHNVLYVLEHHHA